MNTTTERTISPKTTDDINQELIQLFSATTFSDDLTRLSAEIRAIELMHEKRIIKQKLEEITDDSIAWKESSVELAPSYELTKKGQFIRNAQQELLGWKGKLARLQYRSRIHSAFLGTDVQRKLAMLKTHREFLHLKLSELKTASNKHWFHVKNQFELRMQVYRLAYKETLRELH